MPGRRGKAGGDEEDGGLQAPLVSPHSGSGSRSRGGPDMTTEMEPEFQSCYRDKWYRRWILFLLFLIATLQTTDRNIPAILLPKISPEFNMTDADAGMLNGAAFVLIYALATIPIARIADMCGRKHLLAGSLIVWSTLTSLSGLSQNTAQLCFLRVGIGLGEAGCTPAAQSLIAVMYGPGERASAMAVQQLGLAVGTAAANLIGGLLIDSLGWRGVFGVMGIPGFVLAGLLLATLEDPTTVPTAESESRLHKYGGGGAGGSWLAMLSSGAFWKELWGGIKECATHLGKRPTFVHLSIGVMIQVGVGLSIMAFLPIFLVRCHHMTTKAAGLSIAEVGGLFGGVGIITGGLVGDWLVQKSGDQRWMLWFILACNIVAAPLMVLAVLVDDRREAIYLSAIVVALFMVMVGPPGAIVQSLVPDRMRATAAGFFGVLANLVGGSLGPLFIGYLSDRLHGTYGHDSIRYALAWSMLFCVWGQIHWFLASRAMPTDMVEGVKGAPPDGPGGGGRGVQSSGAGAGAGAGGGGVECGGEADAAAAGGLQGRGRSEGNGKAGVYDRLIVRDHGGGNANRGDRYGTSPPDTQVDGF